MCDVGLYLPRGMRGDQGQQCVMQGYIFCVGYEVIRASNV